MTRLTCRPLLLEAYRQSCVRVNILDHLQIPQFRLVAQIRLPVLGAPGSRPLLRLPFFCLVRLSQLIAVPHK